MNRIESVIEISQWRKAQDPMAFLVNSIKNIYIGLEN